MSKRKTPFLPYEGRKANDKHIRITHSMLISEPFKGLSKSAIILYIYMKDWACGRSEFEYPQSLCKDILSSATFWSCVDELEQAGFIEVKKRGRLTRYKNIYRFSSKWLSL